MDDQVSQAAESIYADCSETPKDKAKRSSESESPFSETAARLTKELTTVEKLVEIAMKASPVMDDHGRINLKPLAVHATERTLKTLQLIKESHDKVAQHELLLIVEEVVEFRSRELARLLKIAFQPRKREQIDEVINEIFSLC